MSPWPAWPEIRRVLLVVCDSFGVGQAPDAEAYGDSGSNTLGHVAEALGGLRAPNLAGLGLGRVTPIAGLSPEAALPGTAHGRLTERSAGKDSTTGHWEIAGLVLDRPFPTYPKGFPPEVIEPFERAIGRQVLGNVAASGTEIIERLGEEHLRTGRPIVYTSADSVFQIACHVDVLPLQTLYGWCRIARALLDREHRVGRVIARPFEGQPGSFRRTPERRDFSVSPPGPTLLDAAKDAGVTVFGVGKIGDIFAGRGLSEFRYSRSNDHGIDLTIDYLGREAEPVLVATNLVDFDTKFGHRADPEGYGRCVEEFDRRLPELVEASGAGTGEGAVFITGDHGCDPTTPGTDHTREFTPVLAAGARGEAPVDVGTRDTFADLGATIAEILRVGWRREMSGMSFAERLAR